VARYLERIKERDDELKDMTLYEILDKGIDKYIFRVDDKDMSTKFGRMFARLLKSTNLLVDKRTDDVRTLYSLRHFYATRALTRTDITPYQLAEFMGTSVGMLKAHYGHLELRNIADKFAGTGTIDAELRKPKQHDDDDDEVDVKGKMSNNVSQTTRFLKIDNSGLVMARGLLYKYKSLENEKQINYVIELITKQKIYCPKPSQLNDDKEFKPELVIGDLTDTVYLSKVRQWAEKIMSNRHPRPSEEEIQNELSTLTESKLRKLAEESTNDYRQSLNDRFRVVSLSTTPNNQHLWKSMPIKIKAYVLNLMSTQL